MAYNEEKFPKVGQIKEFAEGIKKNYATKKELNALSGKVDELVTTGGEPNTIEKIAVNGTEQTVTNKKVDITVPTKVSDLSNDSKFQTDTDVTDAVDAAINKFATDVSDDGVVNTYKELVDYAASHKGEAATFAGDIAKNTSDITTLTESVDGKVDKVTGKDLSSNDYTTAEKEKLAGIEVATDAEMREMLTEVFGEDFLDA